MGAVCAVPDDGNERQTEVGNRPSCSAPLKVGMALLVRVYYLRAFLAVFFFAN
jgi:hypothetical protein